jgi:hypothetical protein
MAKEVGKLRSHTQALWPVAENLIKRGGPKTESAITYDMVEKGERLTEAVSLFLYLTRSITCIGYNYVTKWL